MTGVMVAVLAGSILAIDPARADDDDDEQATPSSAPLSVSWLKPDIGATVPAERQYEMALRISGPANSTGMLNLQFTKGAKGTAYKAVVIQGRGWEDIGYAVSNEAGPVGAWASLTINGTTSPAVYREWTVK
jgi:hypothetical protein